MLFKINGKIILEITDIVLSHKELPKDFAEKIENLSEKDKEKLPIKFPKKAWKAAIIFTDSREKVNLEQEDITKIVDAIKSVELETATMTYYDYHN